MVYSEKIQHVEHLSFESIIKINEELVPSQYKRNPWDYPGMDRGKAILINDEQLSAYIAAYGKIHQDKINEVLPRLTLSDFQNTDIQIFDWGCGQGLATICLFDFFKEKGIALDLVKKVVLIEPSKLALGRAKIHIGAYLNSDDKMLLVNKYLDDVLDDEIKSETPITIHLFSNILDIPSIDLQQLALKIKNKLSGKHYFICLGPLYYMNNRIDAFWNYFSEATMIFENAHLKQVYNKNGELVKTYKYTAKNRVFKIDGDSCELIFVDYYLPKQFHAAYQLDSVQKILSSEVDAEKLKGLYRSLSEFEIQTPFDIGASIYEDVHPVLAVLNNIITRGLPTKASPYIEEAFASFGNRKNEDDLGAINYCIDGLNSNDLFLAMHLVDSRWKISDANYNCKVLDSDLEKEFITKAALPIIRQLMQPQRDLSSITNKSSQHSQRVDFAFEYPYPTKDINGNNRKGHAIELDGFKYHSGISQQFFDQQRVNELVSYGWYCVRLNEDEINIPYNDFYIGSEYVQLTEKAYSHKFDTDWVKSLQLVLTPIAIARMEKTILEALITGKLDIHADKWKVLAIEHDVPCVALAFEDLKTMFNHITHLTEKYSSLSFPEVELTIISTKEFANSALHLNNKTLPFGYKSNYEFDMVIDCAILRRGGLEKIDFSQYRCKNNCYFNIRSSHYHRNERQIYTSDRIIYKPLVISNAQGKYDDIEENVKHLKYFLNILFRKSEFRPGQTPILSRALQNKSVIGLLPTGGGKSLTYQIAAMLQPGITLVIDPLRSLMKDQYDGLIKAGIDTCTYINSAIEVPKEITDKKAIEKYRIEERERRAQRMESSELQFIFLSPERLSIKNFRERLKNMHGTGVYFSYGVIDEVHCVSEWGHDFRFSYLHLGRNLYRNVLPKQTKDNDDNNHITLFGLTATASFDVLADVERELSGNGAFPLDSDTIVRDGNTNRFELQYKIEPVQILFEENKNGTIKLDDFWEQNDGKWSKVNAMHRAKNEALEDLISKIPVYLSDLLTNDSVQRIRNGYEEGPRHDSNVSSASLLVDIPSDMLEVSDSYSYGGIVFCPHKKNTGLSVFVNADKLKVNHPVAAIGTFVGSNNDEQNDDDIEDNTSEDENKKSFENLERFRDNKISLMIATKAFGMGIDKPNVRYTINMNYSSSLESFVQEAGRAGRDRKMALSTIMFSKYKIARLKPTSRQFSNWEKNRWYDANKIDLIAQQKKVPISDFEICDETSDLVKLKCKQCGDYCKRFERQSCNTECNYYDKCKLEIKKEDCKQPCKELAKCPLARIPNEMRTLRSEYNGNVYYNFIYEHLHLLKSQYSFLTNENYEFLNTDYETVMFFYNNNFKGELVEKQYMYQLLSKKEMDVYVGEETKTSVAPTIHGFLATLQSVDIGVEIVSYINYANEYADIAKAIYRMCCIELIEDFTQDYKTHQFRIVSVKKAEGEYYNALERYLQRYYSSERAKELLKDVTKYKGENEIHKCLGFLTHFIYDKIAVKRKRAIDDMHSFCIHGINEKKDWKDINEELKDELYFYFNSKYARRGYVTESGLNYSLTDDTEEGKISSPEVLFKYMNVVDNEWIANNSESGTTQIDNAKHLYGAVRLIRRQITDDNASIYMLAAFCLMFLGTNNNKVLENELENMYIDGMKTLYKSIKDNNIFWKEVFEKFNRNQYVAMYFDNNGALLKSATILEIHQLELESIKTKYTE
jgi:superfamily II DNA helicase RecQ